MRQVARRALVCNKAHRELAGQPDTLCIPSLMPQQNCGCRNTASVQRPCCSFSPDQVCHQALYRSSNDGPRRHKIPSKQLLTTEMTRPMAVIAARTLGQWEAVSAFVALRIILWVFFPPDGWPSFFKEKTTSSAYLSTAFSSLIHSKCHPYRCPFHANTSQASCSRVARARAWAG